MGDKNRDIAEYYKKRKRGERDDEMLDRIVGGGRRQRKAKAEEREAKREYREKRSLLQNVYTVQPGDSWFSIAGSEMGDQRYAGNLARANPGFDVLKPGTVIMLPPLGGEETPVLTYEDYEMLEGIQEKVEEVQEEVEEDPVTNEAVNGQPEGEAGASTLEDHEERKTGFAALGETGSDEYEEPFNVADYEAEAQLIAQILSEMSVELQQGEDGVEGASNSGTPAQEEDIPSEIEEKIERALQQKEGILNVDDDPGASAPPLKVDSPSTDKEALLAQWKALRQADLNMLQQAGSDNTTITHDQIKFELNWLSSLSEEEILEVIKGKRSVDLFTTNDIEQYLEKLMIRPSHSMTDQVPFFGNSAYTISDLPLDKLDHTGTQVLADYLGMGINNSGMSLDVALEQADVLQKYWNVDNQEMISYLREVYYADLLDPFIADAKNFDAKLVQVDGVKNAIPEEDAALALTLFRLSTAVGGFVDEDDRLEGYKPAPIPVLIEGDDKGFDHVIAGLDAYFNPIGDYVDSDTVKKILGGVIFVGEVVDGDLAEIILDGLQQGGLEIGKGDVELVSAVTYLGDLGGVVQRSMQSNDLKEGYTIEMPEQDLEGDVMAYAVINSGLLEDESLSLSEILHAAYDPQGEFYPRRYQLFAEEIGLEILPETGQILNWNEFSEKNMEIISVYAIGLYAKDIDLDANSLLSPYKMARGYSELAIDRFLDEIQENIQEELGLIN